MIRKGIRRLSRLTSGHCSAPRVRRAYYPDVFWLGRATERVKWRPGARTSGRSEVREREEVLDPLPTGSCSFEALSLKSRTGCQRSRAVRGEAGDTGLVRIETTFSICSA